MKSVAITGSSIFVPNGTTSQALWESLVDGIPRNSKWPRRELVGYPTNNVIAIPEESWEQITDLPGITRSQKMAGFLTRQALETAALPSTPMTNVGCALGTTTAAAEIVELAETDKADLKEVPKINQNADLVPKDIYDWGGPTFTLSTACSSGLLAPVLAAQMINSGEAEAMIAGGMDVLLEYTICGFNSLRVAIEGQCKPFDQSRMGVVLSEGGACFCLEKLEEAQARRANIQGLIIGYGISCDGGHPTAPSAEGIGRAIRQALTSANVEPSDIAGIIAHGTGTPTNDKIEVEALRNVFGEVPLPPLTSVKSALGHAQGGAGSIALYAALAALERGYLPGVSHLNEIDPALGDLPVKASPIVLKGGCLMVNAFGFGGNNCVMIVATQQFLDERKH